MTGSPSHPNPQSLHSPISPKPPTGHFPHPANPAASSACAFPFAEAFVTKSSLIPILSVTIPSQFVSRTHFHFPRLPLP
jgi:hypothetical protein